MILCKKCEYCHVSGESGYGYCFAVSGESGYGYCFAVSGESGYGYCFAPLPYWVNVDRGVAVVVGVIEDDLKRTCHCFREKPKETKDNWVAFRYE